jgi:multidrug resistance efflux pump
MTESVHQQQDQLETVQTPSKPKNPMRTVILAVLVLLLILFAYHVVADRYTPYTSQARVVTFHRGWRQGQ